MTQPNDNGLRGSMWAAAPAGYNAGRRWANPPAHDTAVTLPPTQPQAQPQPHPVSTTSANRTDFNPTSYRPPAPPKGLAPAQALHRLEQTCLRLRWKSLDLEASYNRVLHAADYNFAAEVAERNFKLDFYEFYAWIEQAIELLHRVFGVEILSIRTVTSGFNSAPHAFHHNVLKELEDKNNPLYEVMGRGEVNAALWKAKELRNRWKEGGKDVPLGMYDLKWIVGRVLEGLEGGYGRARERVEIEGQQVEKNGEEGWGWMAEEEMDLDEDVG